jgi:hypothetical protein
MKDENDQTSHIELHGKVPLEELRCVNRWPSIDKSYGPDEHKEDSFSDLSSNLNSNSRAWKIRSARFNCLLWVLAGAENFTQSFARHGDSQPDWRPWPDFAAPLWGEAET